MSKRRKSDSPMMNFGLRFLDYDLEASYNSDIFGYQKNYLTFFAISGVFVSLEAWLTNPNGMKKFEGMTVIFNSLNICVLTMLSICLLIKKKLQHSQFILFIIQGMECIGFIELSRKNVETMRTFNLVMIAIYVELVMLIPMISRCHWKLNAISGFYLNFYANIRFVNSSSIENDASLYTSFLFFSNFLIITLGSYISEKYDRKLYYQNKLNEKSLKKFEFIIREIFPSAIIIHNNKKIVFYNKETLNLLDINSEETVEEKILAIKLNASNKSNADSETFRDNNTYSTDKRPENNPLLNKSCVSIDNLIVDGNIVSNFEKYTGVLSINPLNDEEKKHLDIKIGKIIWEGEEAILSIVTEDFSAQRISYLNEQSRYKDQLLATVSHDLRTPLNGVIGILELTLQEISDKSTRKHLTLALRSSKLLLFMINDILDFSQIDQGKLSLNPSEFCLIETIKEVIKLIKFQTKQKGIGFEFLNDFPQKKKLIMYNDPNRLKQIILNLLSNALKFTQTGFIKISIEPNEVLSELIDESKDYITVNACRISVEDTGSGIKKVDIPKLFQLFGRLDNKRSRKLNPNGIGLGLVISQSLVKLLNKNAPNKEELIKVKSEYGKGATFSFVFHSMILEPNPNFKDLTFKRYENTEDDFSETDEKKAKYVEIPISLISQSQKATKVKKRILLVDDDQINAIVFKTYFKSFDDCEYDMVFDGAAALDLIKIKAKENYFYDLIFMDCNMPIMDGFEATKRVLELVQIGEIPNVSIIASTANVSNSDLKSYLAVGMKDFISKPFKQAEVRKKIDILCGKK